MEMLQTQLFCKMSNTRTQLTSNPDVANSESSPHAYTIEKVGMERIQVPILLSEKKNYVRVPAYVNCFVNIKNPLAKGIHMSRLYNKVTSIFESTPFELIDFDSVMKELATSQDSLSTNSYLSISFEYNKKQMALLSDNAGWRYYPVTYFFSYENQTLITEIKFEITYSSTCPCSAALSRQLLTDKFKRDFQNGNELNVDAVSNWLSQKENMGGVPHAQRSIANIKVKFNSQESFSIEDLLNETEETLKTVVQASVKRVDEQAFAKLNAENLMFCEDAVRILKHSFESKTKFIDYYIKVEHFESLHPHNAVAIVTKGNKAGYKA